MESLFRGSLTLCLMAKHEPSHVMDQLLAINKEPDYKDGAARETLVSIIRMYQDTSPDLAQTYRCKLSSMLNN